jgi:hypothetical protein
VHEDEQAHAGDGEQGERAGPQEARFLPAFCPPLPTFKASVDNVVNLEQKRFRRPHRLSRGGGLERPILDNGDVEAWIDRFVIALTVPCGSDSMFALIEAYLYEGVLRGGHNEALGSS